MKTLKNIFPFALLAALLVVASCKKEDTIDPNEKGSVVLEFDNIYEGQQLKLNDVTYKTAAGEDINISQFDYFVSNIHLVKEDGSEYIVPQDNSYFLVKESNVASQTLTLTDVPAANYKSVKFMIGVDSLRNTMDVSKRTGILDPAAGAAGMYWSWNSGYIFMKMEGTSPSAPLDSATNLRKFRMHIGGFGGLNSKTINNIKEASLTDADGEMAKVRASAKPTFHITVDASKVLNGSTNVSLKTNATTMFNAFSVNVANNYQSMFKVDHVHN
ncbi:MAG: hypothetical protein JNL70_02445 [Saprospiraceae bacterium]|nr:hypothetical protein [Saprospiraceae bacterium]